MANNKAIFGNQVIMDISDSTVTAAKLLRDETAYDRDGEKITGTCDFDMDTSSATATAETVLEGETFGAKGTLATGTMPNNGGVSGTISTVDGEYTIPQGYHDGSGTVEIASAEQAKIIAENIKDGVEILGVTGTYTGEGVTAQTKNATPYTTAQQILPDSGYDYLAAVNIAAISYSETPTPGTNGTTVTIGAVAPSP